MDRHLNIFYAYRHGSTADAEGENVLEDNVTRALIITLRSSEELTKAFLKEFTGVNTYGEYKHGLQGRPESDKPEAGKRKSLPGKCLIVIAGRPEVPKSLYVPDEVLDKLESQTKDSLKTIRNTLERLSNQVREGTLGEGDVGRELTSLLARNCIDAAGADLNDSSLPFYLFQLTLGSRPDAWITSDQLNAVFESKLQGRISDVQIRRHISKGFGPGLQPEYFKQETFDAAPHGRVPVVLWSWRDVYSFFNRFRDEQSSALKPKPKTDYVVCQFLGRSEQSAARLIFDCRVQKQAFPPGFLPCLLMVRLISALCPLLFGRFGTSAPLLGPLPPGQPTKRPLARFKLDSPSNSASRSVFLVKPR